MIARYATLTLAAIAIGITLLIWGNEASSSNLATLSAMCRNNPNCIESSTDAGGRTLFLVRAQDTLVRLACSADGTCLRVEPKAPRASIVSAARLISAD